MSNEPATNYVGPTPCPVPNMSLVGKRIIVMQRQYCERPAVPVSVHDTLDGAMADIGKRSAALLTEWNDTATNALYLVTVDR